MRAANERHLYFSYTANGFIVEQTIVAVLLTALRVYELVAAEEGNAHTFNSFSSSTSILFMLFTSAG